MKNFLIIFIFVFVLILLGGLFNFFGLLSSFPILGLLFYTALIALVIYGFVSLSGRIDELEKKINDLESKNH